jgi:para-nitrobenzyl esterase
MPNLTVQTSLGAIAGTLDGDVRVFRGIPFAAPPIGARRWAPAEPPQPWTGVRDGSRFGDDPMQLPDPKRNSRAAAMSEDCLTLTIWTPAEPLPGGAPVLIWFDGGGFIAGTGARAATDGVPFAQRGVVLVTANYRVGAFGYLAHPGLTAESPHRASGNYGFHDQLAALRWVREHIAAFGGDPARVTAFGESAGGASVAALLISPLARGLVDRVIMQSPGSFRPLSPLADAERAGVVAGGDDLAALRGLSADEVLALNPKINPAVRGLTIPRPLRPIIDGWSIPRDEVDAFVTGDFAPLPTLVGSNADEGGYFSTTIPVTTIDELRAYLHANFPGAEDEAWATYGTDDPAAVKRAVGDVFGDAQFSYGARGLARTIAVHQPLTFRYVFTHAGALTAPRPVHADDIAYVFGTGDFRGRDREVSDVLLSAWVNFAATGDPNGAGVPSWAPYDLERDNALEIGGSFGELREWRAPQLRIFERYYAQRAHVHA